MCNSNEGLFFGGGGGDDNAAAEEGGKGVCLTKCAGTNDLQIKPGHYIVQTCMWFWLC